MSAVTRSRFYPLLAMALALVVFTGFARTFYLREWFDVPPLTVLMYLHGIVFSMWVALYIIQTRLIAAHQVRAHMRLGISGLVLAALIVAVGLLTTAVTAGAPRVRPMGMNSPQFSIVPMVSIIAFGALVAAAVLYRHRPAIHKRLMTLGMIAILPPATARLIALMGLGEHWLLLQTAVTVVFVVACVAGDWIKHRTVHPIYAIGGSLLVLSWPLRVWVAHTETWVSVGSWMAKMGTFLVS